MKKHLYLLLTLLTLAPTLATQKIITSTIIASTLVLSHRRYNKKLSLDLHKAVEQNNTTNALQLITNTQVDIHAKVDYGRRKKGYTPLIVCAWKGNKWLPIAQALLKRKDINVNLQNNDGETPLMMCCKTGDDALPIAQALLKHQHININLPNKYGWTPLIWCADEGDKSLPIAQELLKHQHINVNLKNKYGWTPLIVCCWKGEKSLHIAQELLKHKNINVNLQDKLGCTPLIWCADNGDKSLQIAQALLKHNKINVNLQNNNGCTPLDTIIYWIKDNRKYYTYVQLWNLLVAQGALLNKQKKDYENLKPSDFNEPQKTYVQAIKNNPFMIISLKLSSLTQENERLRKQLEKLQKTSTQQLDHKNNPINKLKDQTQRLTNQLATANQLKDKQQ